MRKAIMCFLHHDRNQFILVFHFCCSWSCFKVAATLTSTPILNYKNTLKIFFSTMTLLMHFWYKPLGSVPKTEALPLYVTSFPYLRITAQLGRLCPGTQTQPCTRNQFTFTFCLILFKDPSVLSPSTEPIASLLFSIGKC